MQLRLPKRVYFGKCRAVRIETTGALKLYCPVLESDPIPDDRWLRDFEKRKKQELLEKQLREAEEQKLQDTIDYQQLKKR